MSQENVNTVRGMYEAFGKGDIPTVIAALDPKVEWREAENFIYADNAALQRPGDNCASDKLSMRDTLIPVRCKRLLD